FHPALNEIALIGYDLTFDRLDAQTGRLKHRADVNGGADFTQVQTYRGGYLVVVDMSTYREKDRIMKTNPRSLDRLEYYDGSSEDSEWFIDFPIGARLLVAGNELFAVKYRKDSVSLQPI